MFVQSLRIAVVFWLCWLSHNAAHVNMTLTNTLVLFSASKLPPVYVLPNGVFRPQINGTPPSQNPRKVSRGQHCPFYATSINALSEPTREAVATTQVHHWCTKLSVQPSHVSKSSSEPVPTTAAEVKIRVGNNPKST